MAIGLDIMFVTVEGTLLTAPHEAIDRPTAHILVGVTIAVSTIMNVVGFAENAPDAWRYLAAGFGALVPSLIYG